MDHHLHHERGTAPPGHWHHRASFGCNSRFGLDEALPSRADTSQGSPVDSEDTPPVITRKASMPRIRCQASFRLPFAEVAARPAQEMRMTVRNCSHESRTSVCSDIQAIAQALMQKANFRVKQRSHSMPRRHGKSAKPDETSQVSFEQWPQAFSKPTALACNPEKPSVRQCKY